MKTIDVQSEAADSTFLGASAEPSETEPTDADRTSDASSADREQRIREIAYQLYQARGGGAGREVDDWLEAKAQVEAQARFEARQSPSGEQAAG